MSQFVKKINELTNINDEGPGYTDADTYIVQSGDNNLTYSQTLVNLRGAVASPNAYPSITTSFEGEVDPTGNLIVTSPNDGALFSATVAEVGTALRVQKDYAVFFQDAVQDLVQDVWQDIVWQAPLSYTGAISDWWSISNPSRIIFKGADTGALYKIQFVGVVDTDTTGYRGAKVIQSNGSPTVLNPERYVKPSDNYTVVDLSCVLMEPTPSNYFRIQMISSSATDVPTLNAQTFIIVERIN